MILKAVLEDGSRYKTEGFRELVRALKLSDWVNQPETKGEYMEQVKRRNEIFMGEEIQYSSCKEFVLELVRVNMITRLVIE